MSIYTASEVGTTKITITDKKDKKHIYIVTVDNKELKVQTKN